MHAARNLHRMKLRRLSERGHETAVIAYGYSTHVNADAHGAIGTAGMPVCRLATVFQHLRAVQETPRPNPIAPDARRTDRS